MRNNRFSPMKLAAGAIAVALIAGTVGAANAREFNGDRLSSGKSWNGNSGRGDNGSSNARRGNSDNHRDGSRHNNGGHDHGWNGDRGHNHGHGNWSGRRHWSGGYNPWLRNWRSADEYSGFDRPSRHKHHRWNRYW